MLIKETETDVFGNKKYIVECMQCADRFIVYDPPNKDIIECPQCGEEMSFKLMKSRGGF